jgi:hypothetical protein
MIVRSFQGLAAWLSLLAMTAKGFADASPAGINTLALRPGGVCCSSGPVQRKIALTGTFDARDSSDQTSTPRRKWRLGSDGHERAHKAA